MVTGVNSFGLAYRQEQQLWSRLRRCCGFLKVTELLTCKTEHARQYLANSTLLYPLKAGVGPFSPRSSYRIERYLTRLYSPIKVVYHMCCHPRSYVSCHELSLTLMLYCLVPCFRVNHDVQTIYPSNCV